MSSSVYNHNVVNKISINKGIKGKILNSAVLFLNNNSKHLPYNEIKNLTLVIQKSMNDNKLTQEIIEEQSNNIKEYFGNDGNKAKLLIHYIIIMARHSSTNTTKINWFFYKDGVNKTSTINNFLVNIKKENTKESTQALFEGLRIIHNIYIINKDSFDQLQLNSFNIGDYTLNVKSEGYAVKLENNEDKLFDTHQLMSLSYTLHGESKEKISQIIRTEKILRYGKDISSHYLSKNSKYQIFRFNVVNNTYKNGVYVIDRNNFKSLLMWEKTDKLTDEDDKDLGHGEYGVVSKITNTKAIKKPKSQRENLLELKKSEKQKEKQKELKKLKEINEHLLTAQFTLSERKIGIFIFGLYNTKQESTKGNIGFMMPVISEFKNELDSSQNLILFIHMLKKFNEVGYFHPDLSNHPFHYSPQNVKIEENKVPVTFDLDSKLEPGIMTNNLPIKDQWLWFYCNMVTGFQDKRGVLEDYYKKNSYKAVSDNKVFLNQHFPELLNELNIKIPTMNSKKDAYSNIPTIDNNQINITIPTTNSKKDAYSKVPIIDNNQIKKDFNRKYPIINIIKDNIKYELQPETTWNKVTDNDKSIDDYLDKLLSKHDALLMMSKDDKSKLKDFMIIAICQNIRNPIADSFKLENPEYDIFRLNPEKLGTITINFNKNEILYSDLELQYIKTINENGDLLNFDFNDLPSIAISPIKMKIIDDLNNNVGILVEKIYKDYSVIN